MEFFSLSDPVTLAVVNARVWTGNPQRPWADAIAVCGERIALVGSSAEVRKLASAATQVVDAGRSYATAGAAASMERGAPADFVLTDLDPSERTLSDSPEGHILLTIRSGRVIGPDGTNLLKTS